MTKKSTEYNSETARVQGLEAIQEEYKLIIDEYYNNGFQSVKAVHSTRPDLSPAAARVLMTTIKKRHSEYIQQKQQALRAETQIRTEQIVNELINLAYSDVTTYAGLNPEDLKALPAEQRRAIQSIKHHKTSYTDRAGKLITEENTEVRTVNKIPAFDMLAKYIGLYDADNKQRAPKIDIKSLNIEQLNVLHQVLKQTNKD